MRRNASRCRSTYGRRTLIGKCRNGSILLALIALNFLALRHDEVRKLAAILQTFPSMHCPVAATHFGRQQALRRGGSRTIAQIPENSSVSAERGTESGTVYEDSGLSLIINSWQRLPEHIRATIATIIRSCNS